MDGWILMYLEIHQENIPPPCHFCPPWYIQNFQITAAFYNFSSSFCIASQTSCMEVLSGTPPVKLKLYLACVKPLNILLGFFNLLSDRTAIEVLIKSQLFFYLQQLLPYLLCPHQQCGLRVCTVNAMVISLFHSTAEQKAAVGVFKLKSNHFVLASFFKVFFLHIMAVAQVVESSLQLAEGRFHSQCLMVFISVLPQCCAAFQ